MHENAHYQGNIFWSILLWIRGQIGISQFHWNLSQLDKNISLHPVRSRYIFSRVYKHHKRVFRAYVCVIVETDKLKFGDRQSPGEIRRKTDQA